MPDNVVVADFSALYPGAEPIFKVTNVSKAYKRSRSIGGGVTKAVDDVSLNVFSGQRLGIVGESGSGKSSLVRLMLALQQPTSGDIEFYGKSIIGLKEKQLADLRANVQMIFQDPRSSLNPRMKVARIITEPLRSPLLANRPDVPRASAERIFALMTRVGLDPDLADRYPHEFSGGQRQRIAITRSLASRPEVLIADEAVSALDVSVRAQVLNLIVGRVKEHGLTLLFVSHDLSVVRHVCNTVIVMKNGRIVEAGPIEQVYQNPQDPYTQELLAAVPKIKLRH